MSHFVLRVALSTAQSYGNAEARTRQVPLNRDQIAAVRTALGIATIIQAPDRPNSVVLGDQNAFKVEYLDQAIAIKPLHAGARSNLYIYTDWRRYNIQLISGPIDAADYVVYLKDSNPPRITSAAPAGIRWRSFMRSMRNEAITIKVNKLGRISDGVLLVDFTITGKRKESFQPGWFWLMQKSRTRPINSLKLSHVDLGPDKPIRGMIQVLASDVDPESRLVLEFRRKKTTRIQLPEVSRWR